MIVASDQGAVVSLNGTADTPEWSSWYNQPTAQLYHLSVTHGFPWIATGAQQDSGAVWVRSRSYHGHDLTARLAGHLRRRRKRLHRRRSARSQHPLRRHGEPVQPALNGERERHRRRARSRRAQDWTQPLVFSKADPHALYYANQYLYKMTDGGATWTRISDDLTRPEPGRAATLDPTTAPMTDRNGRRGVIYTIAPSPVLKPLLWIGTDDGLIQLTMDDGRSGTTSRPRR